MVFEVYDTDSPAGEVLLENYIVLVMVVIIVYLFALDDLLIS